MGGSKNGGAGSHPVRGFPPGEQFAFEAPKQTAKTTTPSNLTPGTDPSSPSTVTLPVRGK